MNKLRDIPALSEVNVLPADNGLNMETEFVIYIIQAIIIGIAIANLFELLPGRWKKYKISVIIGITVLIIVGILTLS